VGYSFISYYFGVDAPLCTNSDRHFVWYTQNDECAVIDYHSCRRDVYNTPPSGTTPGCGDAQRAAYFGGLKDFAENCKFYFEWSPEMQRERYNDFQFISFYGEDRRIDKSAVEACKPQISQQAYEKARLEVSN